MNARRKGRRNELRAAAILREEGWQVELTRPNKYGPEDFFGLWDLVAVRNCDEILWVQVKTNRPRLKEVERSAQFFNGPGEMQVWVFYDGDTTPKRLKVNRL